MSKKLSGLYLVFCGIFIIGFVLFQEISEVAHNNYIGLCREKSKILTDDDVLNAVIHETLKNYPPAIKHEINRDGVKLSYYKPENSITYENLIHFLKLNGDCCRRLKSRNVDEGEPRGLVRWLGLVNGFYEMKYKVRYLNEGSELTEVMHYETFPISNCGERVNWWDPLWTDSIEILYQFYKKWNRK